MGERGHGSPRRADADQRGENQPPACRSRPAGSGLDWRCPTPLRNAGRFRWGISSSAVSVPDAQATATASGPGWPFQTIPKRRRGRRRRLRPFRWLTRWQTAGWTLGGQPESDLRAGDRLALAVSTATTIRREEEAPGATTIPWPSMARRWIRRHIGTGCRCEHNASPQDHTSDSEHSHWGTRKTVRPGGRNSPRDGPGSRSESGDDDSDVIGPAGLQGHGDQGLRNRSQRAAVGKHCRDFSRRDDSVQPVAGQQHLAARPRLDDLALDAVLDAHADGRGEGVAQRVRAEGFFAETEIAADLVDPAIVAGEQRQAAVLPQPTAAVPDVGDDKAGGGLQHRHQSSAHAFQLGVLLGQSADAQMGFLKSGLEQRGGRNVRGHYVHDGLHGDLRRGFSGLRAAHPIGQHTQTLLSGCVKLVLVVGANQPLVRKSNGLKHGRVSAIITGSQRESPGQPKIS